ncbi:MAG: flagellar M-ring protein FliF [Candidatus Eisenbacteria bacterium]|nr:flagellar M-ring protein FliF [Candidatus Eisenbacteria bacterium]
MADGMKGMTENLAARWRVLGSGQKFVLGSLIAGAVVTIVLSFFLAKHASYGVLYAGLDAEQASGVVDRLRDLKVPYRISDSGRTILVPEKDVYAVRLDLAGEGGVEGGASGYELFDQSKFGMTNFMQQVNYQRALEGELTRTIREMDEVMNARVHLVIPERSLFLDGQRAPSAAVMVRLKPGSRLTQKRIEGIGALVAGSVEGLHPENVSILDYFGNLLSTPGDEDGAEVQSAARYEVEAGVERLLEEKAQTLLDRVVGPGNAVVRVTAELDFEKLERNVERFDPDNASVRSEETTEEMKEEEGSEYRTTVTNYELNRTVETVVKAPGNLKRLTVAVTVDGRYEVPEGAEGDAESAPSFVERDRRELSEIEALVRNAVGLDEDRGDQIHVACVQFDQRHLLDERSEMQKVERSLLVRTVLEKALWALGALVVFLVLRRFLRSAGSLLNQAPARRAVEAEGMEMFGAPAAQAVAAYGSSAQKVTQAARNRPEESAELIKTLISESD